MDNKYPTGWGKFKKYTKAWESYIMGDVLEDILKTFPNSKDISVINVGKVLVNHKYMDNIQVYAYKSMISSGVEGVPPFREWTKDMMTFNPSGTTKTVNIWHNNSVRETSRRIVKSIKKNTRHLNERIKNLNKDDVTPEYISSVFSTIDNPSKEMKLAMKRLESGTLSESQANKLTASLVTYIEQDIKEVQYKATVTHAVDGGANFWGKRLSQDQLQEGNIKVYKETIDRSDDVVEEAPELILQGEWFLSPSHKHHYYKGGTDPCEIFAKQRYYYGDDIPIPKESSHYGCRCSLKLTIIDKADMKK